MTQTLQILVGLPASGKSTYAQELEDRRTYKRVNWDQFRWFDDAGNPKPYVFNKQNEEDVKERALEYARNAVSQGYNIVADNTNLTESGRKYWLDFAQKHNLQPVVKGIDTPLEECIQRNKLRTGWQRVPRAVIEWMALTNPYLNGVHRVMWPYPQNTRGTVIVDVDGTLADSSVRQQYITPHCTDTHCIREGACQCEGRSRTKKDWKRFFAEVGNDQPNQAVAEWTRMLHEQGYYVVIVSGRPIDQAGIATEDWLDKYNIPYDRLYMRPAGSNEPDTVVKKRILDAITPHTRIAFAIDDRPSVIRMWRENGVTTYDVGKGEEF